MTTSAFLSGGKSRSMVSREHVEKCHVAAQRIIEDMEGMRASTEEAALQIGDLLVRIVQVATEGNLEVQDSLQSVITGDTHAGGNSEPLVELLQRQIREVSEFSERVSGFFERQLAIAEEANNASNDIRISTDNVSRLTRRSQILALNLRIEADRLGEEGNGFAVLGEEVQRFANQVEQATETIRETSRQLADTVPKMRQQTAEIAQEMAGITAHFHNEMERVTDRTSVLTDSLKITLDQVNNRNNRIMDYSNDTLSYLAFQDPVSQGLRRAEHDIRQFERVLEGEEPDFNFTAITVEDESVAESATVEAEPPRLAGEVELF